MHLLDPVGFVRAQLARWVALPNELKALEARAFDLSRAVQQANPGAQGQVAGLITRIHGARQDYVGSEGTVAKGIEAVQKVLPKGAGLGILPAIPLAVVATAGLAATAMALVFRKTDQAARDLAALERGLLSPEQYAGLSKARSAGGLFSGIGQGLGSVVPLMAAAGIAFILLRKR